MLSDPRLNGIDDLRTQIDGIIERYSHMDLLLCAVDADGLDRSGLLRSWEGKADTAGVRLIACAAVQEVEAWLLAGHANKLSRDWQAVREDVSVKESTFAPFLREFGNMSMPGQGRGKLMDEALARYDTILARCPELSDWQTRICASIVGA